MDELIAELEKIEGGKDLAGKFREKLTALDIDGTKAALTAAEKRAKKAEAEAVKLKDAASAESTEAMKKVELERDEAVSGLSKYKLKTKLERKLGFTDEAKAARAVEALMQVAGDSIDFDDKGDLVGADKAIELFKKKESFWFTADAAPEADPANGGQRAGAGPAPAKGTKEPKTRDEIRAARKAELAARAGIKPESSATH